MDQRDVSAPPAVFRASFEIQIWMVVCGLIGIVSGCLLHVFLSVGSTLTFPVVAPIVAGGLSLLLGLSYFIRPSPAVVVDDDGLVLRPFGRIPLAAISRAHLTRAKFDPNTRYLSIETADPGWKFAERRWPRGIYGAMGKVMTGYPVTMPQRLLRPVPLGDIAAELPRRNPGLVVVGLD